MVVTTPVSVNENESRDTSIIGTVVRTWPNLKINDFYKAQFSDEFSHILPYKMKKMTFFKMYSKYQDYAARIISKWRFINFLR